MIVPRRPKLRLLPKSMFGQQFKERYVPPSEGSWWRDTKGFKYFQVNKWMKIRRPK